MLYLNVAIVWPELANTGPTMLLYVALKCCDLLAGALDSVHTTSEEFEKGHRSSFSLRIQNVFHPD